MQPYPDRDMILIAHNLRSCHNVGSLLRTAEGLGVRRVILTGYTPYPALAPGSAYTTAMADGHPGAPVPHTRLHHITARLSRQIHKTALGAEDLIAWSHEPEILPLLLRLRTESYMTAAIEQHETSVDLPTFAPPDKLALLVGREVEGIEPDILAAVDTIVEIPMFGRKESYNVVQAAAMALYHCRCAGRSARLPQA